MFMKGSRNLTKFTHPNLLQYKYYFRTFLRFKNEKPRKKFIPKMSTILQFIPICVDFDKPTQNLLELYSSALNGYFERILMNWFLPVICSKFPSEIRPIITVWKDVCSSPCDVHITSSYSITSNKWGQTQSAAKMTVFFYRIFSGPTKHSWILFLAVENIIRIEFE